MGSNDKNKSSKYITTAKNILCYIADVLYTYHREPLFTKFEILPVGSIYEFRLLHAICFASGEFVDFVLFFEA